MRIAKTIKGDVFSEYVCVMRCPLNQRDFFTMHKYSNVMVKKLESEGEFENYLFKEAREIFSAKLTQMLDAQMQKHKPSILQIGTGNA